MARGGGGGGLVLIVAVLVILVVLVGLGSGGRSRAGTTAEAGGGHARGDATGDTGGNTTGDASGDTGGSSTGRTAGSTSRGGSTLRGNNVVDGAVLGGLGDLGEVTDEEVQVSGVGLGVLVELALGLLNGLLVALAGTLAAARRVRGNSSGSLRDDGGTAWEAPGLAGDGIAGGPLGLLSGAGVVRVVRVEARGADGRGGGRARLAVVAVQTTLGESDSRAGESGETEEVTHDGSWKY